MRPVSACASLLLAVPCLLVAPHGAGAHGSNSDAHAQLSWSTSVESPQAALAQPGGSATLYVLLLDHVSMYAGGEIELRWTGCADATVSATSFRSAASGCTYLNRGLVSPVVLADEPGHFHAAWLNSQPDSVCASGAVIALQFDLTECAASNVSFALCSLSLVDDAGVAVALDAAHLGSPATLGNGGGTVTCPQAPVALQVPLVWNVVEGDTVRFDLRADGGVAPYAFSATSPLPAGATLTRGGHFVWPVADDETQVGSEPLQFTVTDATGASASAWTTVTVTTSHLIEFEPIASQDAFEGVPFRLPLYASTAGRAPLTFAIPAPAPPGAHITMAEGQVFFDWTPSYTAAETGGGVWSPVRVSATDGVALATQTFSITVHEARPPLDTAPAVDPIAPQGVTEGTTLTVVPHASDAEGDVVTWTGENLPAGASIDAVTGTLHWTPADDAAWFNGGLYDDVTVIADDGFGGVTRVAFPITVFDRAPVIESGGLACDGAPGLCTHFCTAELRSVVLHATNDDDGIPVVWSAEGLPEWLTLDATGGVVQGMAPDAYYGQQLSATLAATDAVSGATAQVGFTFSVDCTPVRGAAGAPDDASAARVIVSRPVSSGDIVFTCELPQVARLALAAFDGAGRALRHLVDDPRAAGRVTVRWDGRDDDGRRAPCGVYFVRGVLGTLPVVVRCVVVR